ncbi:MAG: GNAT family N-acetyltransferase [Planctomycetaceae bacterium]|nr:GNAT family N-acetyltransferase [Planctomycetaceae bacterium]
MEQVTIDEAFPAVEFPISWDIFHRLPRHAGYRYDYLQGQAYLTPEPRQYHCLLDLAPRTAEQEIVTQLTQVTIRPMREADWPAFKPIFERAFRESTPLGQADESAAGRAVREALERTETQGSGPVLADACFAAWGRLPGHDACVMGGLLTTLLPQGDLERFDDPTWTEPPPSDAAAERWGRPHLTWIFVDPWITRNGVASAMLDHAVNALFDMGYRELASTFLLGNESSTLWHWRNGFRLVSYVGSPRRWKRRLSALENEKHVE